MSLPCNQVLPSSNILTLGLNEALNGAPVLQAGVALEFAENFETVRCCVCMDSIGGWDPRVICDMCSDTVLCRDCAYNCVKHRLLKCPVCQRVSFSHALFEFILTDFVLIDVYFDTVFDFLAHLSHNDVVPDGGVYIRSEPRDSVESMFPFSIHHVVSWFDDHRDNQPTINGSNGEWTNADDVEPGVPGRVLRNLAQQGVPVNDGHPPGPFLPRAAGRNRGARGNGRDPVRHINLGGGGPMDNVNRFAPLIDAHGVAVNPDVPPLPPPGVVGRARDEQEEFHQVDIPGGCPHHYFYNGHSFAIVNCADLVQPNTVHDDVVRSGPGWFVTKRGKGKREVARSLFSQLTVPAYMDDAGFVHERVSDWVLVPVVSNVKRFVGGAEVSPQMLKSGIAVADKLAAGSDQVIVEHAIQTAILCHAHQGYIYAQSLNIGGVFPQFYGTDRKPNESFALFEVSQQQLGRPVSLYQEEAQVVAFNHRRDYALSNLRGHGDFGNGMFDMAYDLHGEPTYKPSDVAQGISLVEEPQPLLIWDAANQRKFRTAYCQFVGLGQPEFVEYSNSSTNLMSGLQRMLKARNGEEYYRWHAHRFGQYMNFWSFGFGSGQLLDPIQFSEMSELLFSRTYEADKPLPPDDNLPIEGEDEGAIFTFMAESARILLARHSRDYITATLDHLRNSAHWAYYKGYETMLSFLEPLLSREYNANIDHLKRELRKSYVRGVLTHDDANIMVRRLNACVKRELAKHGKAARLFVSYDAGCMYANELPEYVKLCLDGVQHIRVGDIDADIYIMAKPRTGVLDTLFNTMYDALSLVNYVYYIIYSDDQCIGGNRNGLPFLANVDISSNDSSQDIPAFMMVGLSLAQFHPNRAIGLLRQCSMPIRVTDPLDKASSFDIKFQGLFEGSGSVLTTILNHWGSTLGAYATLWFLGNTGCTPSEAVRRGFTYVGHVVTYEDCMVDGVIVFERMQFLKKSPVQLGRVHNGAFVFERWGAMTNLGCIFRSLGTTWDELTAAKLGVSQSAFVVLSDNAKLNMMCSQVVKGLVHEPDSLILRALRARFCVDTSGVGLGEARYLGEEGTQSLSQATAGEGLGEISGSSWIFEDCQASVNDGLVVSDMSLYSRYDSCADDFAKLVDAIHFCRSGFRIALPVLTKIYKQDYGMPGLDNPAWH